MPYTYTPVWCVPITTLGDTDPITRVTRVAGVTVTLADIAVAVGTIEALTGLIEGVPRTDISARDIYWLGQAVAFQSVWLKSSPDWNVRDNDSVTSQDGATVTHGPDALTLAPIARKCLRRLSWRGVRAMNLDKRLNPQDFRDARYNARLEQREAVINASLGYTGYGFDEVGGASALTDASDNEQGWSNL